jgi:anti-sigma B factor antagonist
LRLLLLLYREISGRKGKLVLVGVSEDIRTVMSHTGFLNFFTLANSEAEAKQAVA